MTATTQRAIWAVVPAAGVGLRMGTDVPKQYLDLGGRCVLEHSLGRLLAHPEVSGAVVAVAADDPYFAKLEFAGDVERVVGGEQRPDSVLNALEHLCSVGRADDWALVHDAVRPCVHTGDLDRLVARSRVDNCGALLAVPVRDTMKRVADGRVCATVPREDLWHALTPQLFPVNALRAALLDARANAIVVTDEAQAMERVGQPPVVVHGRVDNIKITRPDDLELAALFLQQVDQA